MARFCGVDYDKNRISLIPCHASYTDKQLKVLRRVSRYWISPVQEFSGSRIWHWLQKRARSLFLYSILYPSLLIPDVLLPEEELIPNEQLERIRKHYADDWQNCIDYAEAVTPVQKNLEPDLPDAQIVLSRAS
jgi:hypothetical protein